MPNKSLLPTGLICGAMLGGAFATVMTQPKIGETELRFNGANRGCDEAGFRAQPEDLQMQELKTALDDYRAGKTSALVIKLPSCVPGG